MTKNQALEEIRRTSQHSKAAFADDDTVASSPCPHFRQHQELVNLPRFKYHSLLMGLFVVTVGVRILEGMFIIGMIGSFVVIVLTGIEDLKMLLGREEENHS